MGKLIERCAGSDIGKRFLVCCVMTGAAHEEPRSETRRFDTTVPGLKRLRNWFNEEHCGAPRGQPRRRRERRAHHHLRCLRRLGFSVEIRLSSESTPPDTISR